MFVTCFVHFQSSEEIESYINRVGPRRTSQSEELSPDKVCRLLLPSGHYQHVDILHPDPLYQTFVFLFYYCLIFWLIYNPHPPG